MPKYNDLHQALKKANRLIIKSNKAWAKAYAALDEAKALSQDAHSAMALVSDAALAALAPATEK